MLFKRSKFRIMQFEWINIVKLVEDIKNKTDTAVCLEYVDGKKE